jgi:hypothetical protein
MTPKNLLIFPICAMLFTLQLEAQKLSTTEIDSINWKIFDFLQKKVEAASSIESELILVVLQTDSLSSISSIHLLADKENRDKVFDALSRFSTHDFYGWKPKYFRNMSIIIPVYGNSYYPKNKDNYADKIFGEMSFAGEKSKIIYQDKSSVMLSGILWMPKGSAAKTD